MGFLKKHPIVVWVVLTVVGGASLAFGFLAMMSDPTPNPFVYFTIPVGICMVTLTFRDALSCKRRDELARLRFESFADRLGLEFQYEGPANVLGWPSSFELTRLATELEDNIDRNTVLGKIGAIGVPTSANIYSRKTETHNVVLFDYQFYKNDYRCRKGVAAIASEQLLVPYIALFPATFWALKKQRVFHKHRVLGYDGGETDFEAIAMKLKKDMILEVGEGFMLLYYREGRAINPEKIELRITEAEEIYEIVCQHISGVPEVMFS